MITRITMRSACALAGAVSYLASTPAVAEPQEETLKPPVIEFTLEQARASSSVSTPTGELLVVGKNVGLQKAVSLAVERSKQLQANRFAVDAARARAVAVGELPDPILQLQVNNLPADGADQFAIGAEPITRRTVGLQQTWVSGEKRRASAARFEGQAQVAKANLNLVSTEVATGTAMAWLDVFYLSEKLAKYEALQAELSLQAESTQALYEGNVAAQADVFITQAELSLLELKISRARAELQSANAELARWLGVPRLDGIEGNVEVTTLGEKALRALHSPSDLPAVQVAKAKEGVAQANLQSSIEQTKADWTSALQFSKRGSQYSDTVSVLLSRPLLTNTENRQLQEQTAAQAELKAAQAITQDTVFAQTSRLATFQANWQEGITRLKVLQNELLPLAAQRVEAAMAAYQGGTSGLPAVLMARKTQLELQIEHIQTSREVARWWAALEYALPVQEVQP